MQRFETLVASVAAGLLVATAQLPARVPAQAAEAPLMRDALWRSIFARPQNPRPAPADPAVEALRQALGSELFNDPRLSGTGTRACSSCHRPDLAFTDGQPRAIGLDGRPLRRNTPHLWNLAEARNLYWDGREPSLEAQARVPLHAANELAVDMPRTLRSLAGDTRIAAAFAAAFPGRAAFGEAEIVAALAAYERTLVSPPTRFDSWVGGDDAALSEREKAGFAIFVGKGGCVSCHGGWRFTDDQFHDIGLATGDPGRGGVPGGTPGIPAFKTPGLRQVARTAPYMHDGSLATLDAVVAHYTERRILRPSLSPNMIRDLELDAGERAALIAFLATL